MGNLNESHKRVPTGRALYIFGKEGVGALSSVLHLSKKSIYTHLFYSEMS